MGKLIPLLNVMNQHDRLRPQMHEAMHQKPLVVQSHAAKRPFTNDSIDIPPNHWSRLIFS